MVMPSKLMQNLANLNARAASGEYHTPEGQPDDDRLLNDVMRLYRLVNFDAPTPPKAPAPFTDVVAERAASEEAPAPVAERPAKCPNARKHGPLSAKGEACPDCGYQKTPTPAPAATDADAPREVA